MYVYPFEYFLISHLFYYRVDCVVDAIADVAIGAIADRYVNIHFTRTMYTIEYSKSKSYIQTK